jgi:hypothetical protein
MPTAALEARVLDHLLNQVKEAKIAEEAATAIWVPTALLATETPLDIVRGIAAKHPWPAEWEARLREISPVSQDHSWLYGCYFLNANRETSESRSRWVLYEMLPYGAIPEGKRLQLGGTPYWEMPKHLRAGRKQACTAFQWEMYRKHKVWARPFWVIQGNDGGTPAEFTEMEQAMLQAKGLPVEPPEPGELPYAPWDGRVEKQLRARDRLMKARYRLSKLQASADNDALKAETVLAEEQFRKDYWAWWKETMEPQAEFWTWFTKREEAQHLPIRQASEAEARAAEETEESFLTTGNIPFVNPLS